MGCFNGTCMISGLPILAGEKARLIVLEKTGHQESPVYAWDVWQPAGFILAGKYNDYGMLERDQTDEEAEFFWKLMQGLFEQKIVNPKHTALEDWLQYDSRASQERIEVRQSFGQPACKAYAYAFILEEVYQYVLSECHVNSQLVVDYAKVFSAPAIGGLFDRDGKRNFEVQRLWNSLWNHNAWAFEMVAALEPGRSEIGHLKRAAENLAAQENLIWFLSLNYIPFAPFGMSSQETDYKAQAEFHRFIAGLADQKQANWDKEHGCDDFYDEDEEAATADEQIATGAKVAQRVNQ